MKTTKLIIAFLFLLVFCASAVWVEYELVLQFGILFSILASMSASFGLFAALLRAPEGYESADGFHVRAGRGQMSRTRRARLSYLTRALKIDMARLFSKP
jgi:hypothetical protein